MENMESSCVPPGFRFRPTEEQLVGYYLKRKVNALTIDLNVIVEVDLYRIEPWDIQDRCKLGYELEQNEWYFFSHKDRKYPTGTRTNRATAAGFWKATGRDKAVLSKERLIGMRKTLVFYKGRAPNGRKTDWIMHEYRIQTSELRPTQDEGWVVCRAFKKPCPSHRQGLEAWNNTYYLMNRSESSTNIDHSRPSMSSYPSTILDNLDHLLNQGTNSDLNQSPFPKLDSPSISTSFTTNENINLEHRGLAIEDMSTEDDQQKISCVGNDLYMYSEWKNFDKLLELESQPSMRTSSSYAYTALLRHDDE